jgi:hypothetical protein
MTYEEYTTIKAELENQLKKLEADYIEEHGLAIGTPVIYLGRGDSWDVNYIGKKYHVADREIYWSGEVVHNIIPAKKDGSAAKKGRCIYHCNKKALQVSTEND